MRPTAACVQSTNDLSGVTVNRLQLDDGMGAVGLIDGNGITLGPGGLSVSTASASPFSLGLSLPITLGAPQTWSVDGGGDNNGAMFVGGIGVVNVTGPPADTLGIVLSHGGSLDVSNGDVEVGPITITGANPSDVGEMANLNGWVNLSDAGLLNGTDGSRVSVTDAAISGPGTVGALTLAAGLLDVGSPSTAPGILAVNGGASLDAASRVSLVINHSGTTAGTDYAQISATGAVNLGGASLDMALSGADGSPGCPSLSLGDVDTIVTTTGSLTGTFAGVPDGTTVPVPISCSPSPGVAPAVVRINYTAHSVTLTVVMARPPPGPVVGRSEEASLVSGIVLVRRPGTQTFTPLTGAALIPDGSELDVTQGRVQLVVASGTPGVTNSVQLYGGRAIVHQTKGLAPRIGFRLSGPLSGCSSAVGRARAAAGTAAHRRLARVKARRPRTRHLWVTGQAGHFGTSGQYVSASVEGATWLTQDSCKSSRVKVLQGVVVVRDLVRHRTVTVHAGHSYTARKTPRPGATVLRKQLRAAPACRTVCNIGRGWELAAVCVSLRAAWDRQEAG